MSYPDPYGVQRWEESQAMYEQQPSKVDILYEQLLCAVQALPDATSHLSATENKDQWAALNDVMDEMIALGHQEYAKFKIESKYRSYNGSSHEYVNIVALKMKMMQALGRMGQEFGSGNPAYDLSQFKNTGGNAGVSVSQIASPYMHQEQRQEMAVNIQQAIERTMEYMSQNHPEDKIAEASKVLEPLKNGDTAWPKVKRAVDFFVGLGREAFFAFAPVLLQLHLQQAPLT